MSRRFWIGTPKGQNTTADTFFNTSRVTAYQVSTSAPTTYPSFFDTFYDALVPTEYIISTTYDVSTAYISNFFYAVNTTRPTGYDSNFDVPVVITRPTADTRITEYYYPGFQTVYFRNTVTSYITNYTYPVPTNVDVIADAYAPASRNTVTSYITQVPIYNTTFTQQNTTKPGFTVSTTYSHPTSATYPDSVFGCYYYDSSGNLTGQDSVPAGCSVISCSSLQDSYASGPASTFFATCRSTPGVTTFLTHVYVGRNTTTSYVVNGQSDPDNEIYDCYPNSDPAVVAYCQGVNARCENCQIYVYSTYETDIGYDRVTSAPATITTCYDTSSLTTKTYVAQSCQTCQLSCTTNYISYSFVPTYYPPFSIPTQYTNIALIGYDPTPTSRNTTTSYQSYVGTTTYISVRSTQYPTSRPTSHLTVTEYYQPTGDFYYDVPTEYTRNTTYVTNVPTSVPTTRPTQYPTDYPTSVPTTRPTQYPTDVATSIPTATPTSNQTSVDTTVITSWLTDNDVTTTYQTSRSTTWFTQ
jgi:hypothetical protein